MRFEIPRDLTLVASKEIGEGGLYVETDKEHYMICWRFYPFEGRGWGNNYGSCYEVREMTADDLSEIDPMYEGDFDGTTVAVIEHAWNSTYATRGRGLTEKWSRVVMDYADIAENITVEKFQRMIEEGNGEEIIDFLKYFDEEFKELWEKEEVEI